MVFNPVGRDVFRSLDAPAVCIGRKNVQDGLLLESFHVLQAFGISPPVSLAGPCEELSGHARLGPFPLRVCAKHSKLTLGSSMRTLVPCRVPDQTQLAMEIDETKTGPNLAPISTLVPTSKEGFVENTGRTKSDEPIVVTITRLRTCRLIHIPDSMPDTCKFPLAPAKAKTHSAGLGNKKYVEAVARIWSLIALSLPLLSSHLHSALSSPCCLCCVLCTVCVCVFNVVML